MLRSEVKSKVELEAKLLAVNQEMQKVTAESGNFERKISEAETKFQIMNDYFKNQEAELKKQLTSQDIQLSQNRDKIAADEQELKLMKVKSLIYHP